MAQKLIRKHQIRNLFFAWIVCSGSAVAALAALELGIRVIDSYFPAITALKLYENDFLDLTGQKHIYDPLLGTINLPKSVTSTFGKPVTINSLGLRGPETSFKKNGDVIRILVLGDSFAWGYGVGDEDHLSRILEFRLRRRGYRVEVLNSGVSGWGTDQEYLYLKNVGHRFSPDVVVVAFFSGNDFRNNVNCNEHGVEKPCFARSHDGKPVLLNVPVPLALDSMKIRSAGKAERITVRLSPAFQKSALARFVMTRALNIPVVMKAMRTLRLIRLTEPIQVGLHADSDPASPQSLVAAVGHTVMIVREMRNFCFARGIPLVLADFGGFLSSERPLVLPAKRIFRSRLRKELPDLFYLDLDEGFHRKGLGIAEITGVDRTHWNPRGHAVAAAALEDFLITQGLLKRKANGFR